MKREIITFKDYFENFSASLPAKIIDKIEYIFEIIETQERISEKFLKHLESGLFEIRIGYQSNIYRIFCCFDEGNLVVLFNGFQKKDQKTPRREVEKALKIMSEYYEYKRKQRNQKL
ncbi:type II toxin-antitoxin system RelE/ParE family toxin [Chryseobacterium foetidum]|uniref:type II toxin-antitoxin system RelE/ParE family toxin n=1 Tax=Chryseobacterium foetidum TaxID=2951057 RepID=UPI0021C5B826|nr:type II toxin-antitoxin system RelE/ParE family toxin [Chryseobacterium foetidum]